jgi:hypothetical protein
MFFWRQNTAIPDRVLTVMEPLLLSFGAFAQNQTNPDITGISEFTSAEAASIEPGHENLLKEVVAFSTRIVRQNFHTPNPLTTISHKAIEYIPHRSNEICNPKIF